MGSAIRLKKLESELLQRAAAKMLLSPELKKAERTALEDAIRKIGEGLLPKPPKVKTGLSCQAAVACFRGVLGDRLVLPPTPGNGYWAQMSRGLETGGFTSEHCQQIAAVAAVKWTGKIKAESLVRQGAVLLSEYTEAEDAHQIDDGDDSWRML